MGGADAISMRGKRCEKPSGEITHQPNELIETETEEEEPEPVMLSV